MNDELDVLKRNNKALSDQLDKVTNDLFEAQKLATTLKNQLDEKKHSEQLGGWAIDRAIESLKLLENKQQIVMSNFGADVISIAESYTKWIMETSAKVAQS